MYGELSTHKWGIIYAIILRMTKMQKSKEIIATKISNLMAVNDDFRNSKSFETRFGMPHTTFERLAKGTNVTLKTVDDFAKAINVSQWQLFHPDTQLDPIEAEILKIFASEEFKQEREFLLGSLRAALSLIKSRSGK